MKIAQLLLLLIGCAIAKAQVVSNTPSAPALTNTLAIYLLADARKPALEDNKLEPKPVLADDDFVAYNTNTQRFAIKAEAAKRLCRSVKEKNGFIEPRVRGDGHPSYGFDWPDTPFVLQALGERVYEGIFSSDFSSQMFFAIPVAKTRHVSIAADSTNDVVFEIGFDAPVIRNAVSGQLDFNYKSVPDPRNDKRIIAAVEKLFQMTNRPSKSTLK